MEIIVESLTWETNGTTALQALPIKKLEKKEQ